MLLAKQNKTSEALQVVEELRQIEPENPDHWLSLGTLRARLKRFDAAESAFRRAISLGPKRAEGRIGLVQMLLATGRNLPEAKTLAQAAVELQPTAENYFVLSAACLSVRDLPGARAAIREATTRDPDNPKYREALGYLQQKLK
jgi:Flp pilus assembly protein TadD